MKTKTIVTVLLVVLISVACTPAATVASPAYNFSLIFQYTPCDGPTPMYVLDTANNTLVYTPLGDTTSITISLRLTDDELESIYQKALSIEFFNYPPDFVVPKGKVYRSREPAASYKISMTYDTMANSVAWTDDIVEPKDIKADQLRELMKLINEIIQSHPEVQQLPQWNRLCA